MAWQQSDLDALDAAIATGAKAVKYADGREVIYRSLTEMRAIREDMVTALTGNGTRSLVDDRVATGMASGVSRGSIGGPYWPGRIW